MGGEGGEGFPYSQQKIFKGAFDYLSIIIKI
jgi:hypothetical protein